MRTGNKASKGPLSIHRQKPTFTVCYSSLLASWQSGCCTYPQIRVTCFPLLRRTTTKGGREKGVLHQHAVAGPSWRSSHLKWTSVVLVGETAPCFCLGPSERYSTAKVSSTMQSAVMKNQSNWGLESEIFRQNVAILVFLCSYSTIRIEYKEGSFSPSSLLHWRVVLFPAWPHLVCILLLV